MSITITLPLDTELAGRLTQEAAKQGVNLEELALDALRRVAAMPTRNELFANANDELAMRENSETALQREANDEPNRKLRPQARRSMSGRVDLSKEREWVRQHRDEYRGQWVVLDGDRLIGHTTDADEATAIFKQARQEGVRAPYVKLIPMDDEPIWMMWQ